MKKNIVEVEYFINNSQYKAFNKNEFERIITQIKSIYGFKTLERKKIIDFLIKSDLIIKESSSGNNEEIFDIYYSPQKKIDLFDIAATRSRSAYFSHYSALFIHNLTLQIPKQIYLTNERITLHDHNNRLTQESIDNTFNKEPRITSNKRSFKNNIINLINGQCHNYIGIIEFHDNLKVSDIERTLIDVVTRPFYSGGVTQVLEAFVNAKDLIDIDKFYNYYKKMDFIYPYHQAIGFYLEKAGYENKCITPFLKIKQEFKFYLTYNMKNKEYSKRWNLFYPKGL